jgi:hypothetical protein
VGVGPPFPSKPLKGKPKKSPGSIPFFSKILVRLLRNRRGKSAKNREREKEKRKVMGVFTVKKTEF